MDICIEFIAPNTQSIRNNRQDNKTSILLMEYTLTDRFNKHTEIPISEDKISDNGEVEKKRICSSGIWILLAAIIFCGIGCFVMMSTNLFNLIIQKNLTLKNNTIRYEAWRRPPVHALLRVYLFNYTNIEEYESKIDDKLKIEEVGPYTYIETLERVNVTYNENGTLTYKDKKMYKFSQELSNGSESDRIIVPNIPFMGAMSFAKASLFANLGIMTALRAIGASPFIELGVHEFLWGYKDQLTQVTRHLISFKYQLSLPEFGILATKNRTQDDIISIYTGEKDVLKTGVINQYGEKSSLDYWESRECNRIDGTDGTIYPPETIKPDSTLYLYVKDMCRRMPMVYNSSKVDDHGISVLRYHLARDVFDNGQVKLENRCFCTRGYNDLVCMPSGVFNVSPCAFGGPILTSLPHFLYGDPILSQDFEGLSPHPDLHETFVEIDPRLGIPLTGKSRFQLNVMVRKSAMLMRKPYKDRLILPVSWMDYGVDRLPDDLSSMIYNLIFFIDLSEIFLSFFFVTAIIIFCGLIIKKLVPRRKKGLLIQNLDLSTVDMPLVVCPGKA